METEGHAGPEEAPVEEQADGLAEQPVEGSAAEGEVEEAIAPGGLTAEQLGRLSTIVIPAPPGLESKPAETKPAETKPGAATQAKPGAATQAKPGPATQTKPATSTQEQPK